MVDSDDELLHFELFLDAGDSYDSVDSHDSLATDIVHISTAVAKPVRVLPLLVKLVILTLVCLALCGSDHISSELCLFSNSSAVSVMSASSGAAAKRGGSLPAVRMSKAPRRTSQRERKSPDASRLGTVIRE